jgi:hypothetical protein
VIAEPFRKENSMLVFQDSQRPGEADLSQQRRPDASVRSNPCVYPLDIAASQSELSGS